MLEKHWTGIARREQSMSKGWHGIAGKEKKDAGNKGKKGIEAQG